MNFHKLIKCPYTSKHTHLFQESSPSTFHKSGKNWTTKPPFINYDQKHLLHKTIFKESGQCKPLLLFFNSLNNKINSDYHNKTRRNKIIPFCRRRLTL